MDSADDNNNKIITIKYINEKIILDCYAFKTARFNGRMHLLYQKEY